MNICNEDFGSSMPSLSLTLNVEPGTCERLQNVFLGINVFFILGKKPGAITMITGYSS